MNAQDRADLRAILASFTDLADTALLDLQDTATEAPGEVTAGMVAEAERLLFAAHRLIGVLGVEAEGAEA